MKLVREGENVYEFYKEPLAIRTMRRLADGSKEYVNTVEFEDESLCTHDWDGIKGEDIDSEHPWPKMARQEAARLGINKYYTGNNCKRKHISQRYTNTGLCIACVAARARKFSDTMKAATNGLVVLDNIHVHPDDVPAMQSMADSLKQARALQEGK